MGFYGNITNTSRTQFQFDRTFANRYEMTVGQKTDGVYMGRYVLVEYDTDTHLDTFLRVQVKSGVMYYNPTGKTDWSTILKKGEVSTGTICYVADENVDVSQGIQPKNCKFYIITSSNTDGDKNAAATYEQIGISESDSDNNYIRNYNIDNKVYKAGRGYDSTVWQKNYVNGEEKYVMIAELNTVVPTFDVVADAPMMDPIVPHFDTSSTDVYYKLHWQAPWGFRVTPAKDKTNYLTNDATSYESDEQVSYWDNSYDAESGVNASEEKTYDGAIYYNKAGFDVTKNTINETMTNYEGIKVRNTGKSGNKYNPHNGSNVLTVQPDIQELSIILPSLGNTVAKIWNMAYGENRARDIQWKDALSLTPIDSIGGMTRNLETFAGCINTAHDVLGMIITDKSNAELNETWYAKHYIYKDGSKYYRIAKEQAYTYVNDATVGTAAEYKYEFKELTGFAQNLETMYGSILQAKELLGNDLGETYDRNTVAGALNTLNKLIDLFESKINKSNPVITNDKGQLATATWTTSQAYSTENWGTGSKTDATTAENQWISYSVDGTNKKITLIHKSHTISDTSSSNNINGNGNTITTYSPIVDNTGHVVGKHTQITTLPYGYKTIIVGDLNAAVTDATSGANSLVATSTQDTITFSPSNKWIKLKGTNETVEIGHTIIGTDDATPNAAYGLTSNVSLTGETKQFNVPTFKFDEAGHIISAATKTVTIPYNFKTISVQNSSAYDSVSASADASIEADTVTDTITIAAGNRWIVLNGDETSGKIVIAHAVADAKTTTSTEIGDKTPKFGESFKVPVVSYDEMGHITKKDTYTVTIPAPSLSPSSNDSTVSNVLTNLTLNTSTGVLTPTWAAAGERTISGYKLATDTSEIANSDTINAAFGKAQKQISTNKSSIESAKSELQKNINTVSDDLATLQGTVTALSSTVSAQGISITNLQSSIDTINSTIAELKTSINQLDARITSLEKA